MSKRTRKTALGHYVEWWREFGPQLIGRIEPLTLRVPYPDREYLVEVEKITKDPKTGQLKISVVQTETVLPGHEMVIKRMPAQYAVAYTYRTHPKGEIIYKRRGGWRSWLKEENPRYPEYPPNKPYILTLEEYYDWVIEGKAVPREKAQVRVRVKAGGKS